MNYGRFSHYAPFIQDYIYEHGWQNLRPIQVAAAEEILTLIIMCSCQLRRHQGKPKRPFPDLSEIYNEPEDSVKVLYIAPLKALINDQYDRLTDLCTDVDIPVWRWHGDVAQTQKRKLLKHPSGILQITPESLESFMINKHMDIPHLFGGLKYIVVDELHSFLRSDRGGQTFV